MIDTFSKESFGVSEETIFMQTQIIDSLWRSLNAGCDLSEYVRLANEKLGKITKGAKKLVYISLDSEVKARTLKSMKNFYSRSLQNLSLEASYSDTSLSKAHNSVLYPNMRRSFSVDEMKKIEAILKNHAFKQENTKKVRFVLPDLPPREGDSTLKVLPKFNVGKQCGRRRKTSKVSSSLAYLICTGLFLVVFFVFDK